MNRRRALLGLTGFAVAGPARAQSALELYASGQFAKAAAAARQQGGPDALALAARALNAQTMLVGARAAPAPLVRDAEADARAAVSAAPRHIEGRLQLATAIGLKARRAGPLAAYANGWGRQIRDLLDAVLADAPRQAWAFAMLGGWHLEAVRKGGPGPARTLGATIAQGRAAFQRAMALDPGQPVIPYYYAACLIEEDAANAAEAATLVRRAVAARPTDAFEREIAARAQTLLAALEAGSVKAAQAEARRFL
jgi:hypothetical protein